MHWIDKLEYWSSGTTISAFKFITVSRHGELSLFNTKRGIEREWRLSLEGVFSASVGFSSQNQVIYVVSESPGVLYAISIAGNIEDSIEFDGNIRSAPLVINSMKNKDFLLLCIYGNIMHQLTFDGSFVSEKNVYLGSNIMNVLFTRGKKGAFGVVGNTLYNSKTNQAFVGLRNKSFVSVDLARNKVLWTKVLAADPDSNPILLNHSVGSAVVFGGGEHLNGFGDNSVWCLESSTGKVIWRYRSISGFDSEPVLISYLGRDRILIGSLGTGELYCLEAETGHCIWKNYVGDESIRSCNHDKSLCITHGSYNTEHAVCRIYMKTAVAFYKGEPVAVIGNMNGDISIFSFDGKKLFSKSVSAPIRADLIVFNGYLIIFSYDGMLKVDIPDIRVYSSNFINHHPKPHEHLVLNKMGNFMFYFHNFVRLPIYYFLNLFDRLTNNIFPFLVINKKNIL